VPAQDEERWGDEYDEDEDDDSDEDGDEDKDRQIYKGDMEWRDDEGDPTEVTKGAMPDDIFYLQVWSVGVWSFGKEVRVGIQEGVAVNCTL